MSTIPEGDICTNLSLYEEYRDKYPEIPADDLRQILEKYGSDPANCQERLVEESMKYLYGTLPATSDSQQRNVVSPSLPRCNSSGSTGSSHSSGRSTPVNAMYTPFNNPHIPCNSSPLIQTLPTTDSSFIPNNSTQTYHMQTFPLRTNTEFATSKADGCFVPSVVSSSRTNLELLQSSNSSFPINANIDERVHSRLSGENFNRMLPFSFTPKSSNDELTLQLGVSDKSTTNSNYLHACYSQQLKRYEKLKKEYDEEKERLRIIIEEISERESELYNHRYVVQPNPTDEQIALLVKENEKLKKSVDELSKNIDRIENGRAFLPPVDVRHHDVHRIPPLAPRPKDIYDRSQSVPCIQPQGSIPMKQLSRPSTERQVRHTISCDESSAYYQVKPSNDSALEDWNLINKVPKFPFVPGEGTSEESQWSCRECTFLNHESLLTCEICNTARHQ